MRLLELKAKVKPGKENELNQVLEDLIPQFSSVPNLKTEVHYNEREGELYFKLSNVDESGKIEKIIDTKNFALFLGSVKVLCDEYALHLPKNEV